MLAEVQPDIVSVCVPNMWHAEIALGAIEAGAHVLCEKPLATSVDEAERMFAAAGEADVVLMADQNTRFQPRNRVLREAVDRGDLGEVYFAETVYARRLGIPGWGSFTSQAASFGGAVCDIGVHALDLAVWLMDNPRPVSVSATTATEFGTRDEVADARGRHWEPSAFDVEDFGAAFVRFELPSGRRRLAGAARLVGIPHRGQRGVAATRRHGGWRPQRPPGALSPRRAASSSPSRSRIRRTRPAGMRRSRTSSTASAETPRRSSRRRRR